MEFLSFGLVIAASVALAVYARVRRGSDNARDFFVASGQLGGVLVFFLTIGETYSIGSVLGFSTGVYLHGAAFAGWFMGYILLSYPVGFVLAPLLWQLGRRTGSMTLADIFRAHFGSRLLEIVVAANAVTFLLPLGQMQFTGLISVMRSLHWHVTPAVLAGAGAGMTFGWVALAGVRAPAYVSVLKDVLLVLAIVAGGSAALLATGLPVAYLPMPAAAVPVRQDMFVVSTILLQSLGLCITPQAVAFVFTARSARMVRRNQILMPLYMLMFPFLSMIAEFVRKRGLAVSSANDVFMLGVTTTLPPWMQGIVAGGCAVSALVILAGVCLAIGPLVSRNMLHGLSDRGQRVGAQVVIGVYLLVSAAGAAGLGSVMVTLNNLYYLGMIQIAPGLLAALCGWRIPPLGIAAGLVAGDGLAVGLYWAGLMPAGVNPGLIGLAANALIVAAACLQGRSCPR
ncbi:sodium:solute symporter [Komagataeibacter nataicola]|uniref:sodium:solute symporter family protein n=1 Tax=Komagataeibacter nataicola TaxID=265960 RepID=UPI0023DCF307|nr:sodium:solute symporter [Komagataeibacter nataicola]WEQ56652.1 sodium:solute symporter [Komagataeibacter nataicola]